MSKRIYFLSDCHFGAQNTSQERIKKKLFFSLLEEIGNKGTRLYLLGDIFDYWFEYKYSIPSLYFDILCSLKELTDAGVSIKMLGGNHDYWGDSFLENEIGIDFFRKPIEANLFNRKCFITHGDGLIPEGDWAYKNILKPILTNRVVIKLFKLLHPDLGVLLAKLTSGTYRLYQPQERPQLEKKYIRYIRDELLTRFDAVIFGHIHIPKLKNFSAGTYLNTGNWFKDFSYAYLDKKGFHLKTMNNL